MEIHRGHYHVPLEAHPAVRGTTVELTEIQVRSRSMVPSHVNTAVVDQAYSTAIRRTTRIPLHPGQLLRKKAARYIRTIFIASTRDLASVCRHTRSLSCDSYCVHSSVQHVHVVSVPCCCSVETPVFPAPGPTACCRPRTTRPPRLVNEPSQLVSILPYRCGKYNCSFFPVFCQL